MDKFHDTFSNPAETLRCYKYLSTLWDWDVVTGDIFGLRALGYAPPLSAMTPLRRPPSSPRPGSSEWLNGTPTTPPGYYLSPPRYQLSPPRYHSSPSQRSSPSDPIALSSTPLQLDKISTWQRWYNNTRCPMPTPTSARAIGQTSYSLAPPLSPVRSYGHNASSHYTAGQTRTDSSTDILGTGGQTRHSAAAAVYVETSHDVGGNVNPRSLFSDVFATDWPTLERSVIVASPADSDRSLPRSGRRSSESTMYASGAFTANAGVVPLGSPASVEDVVHIFPSLNLREPKHTHDPACFIQNVETVQGRRPRSASMYRTYTSETIVVRDSSIPRRSSRKGCQSPSPQKDLKRNRSISFSTDDPTKVCTWCIRSGEPPSVYTTHQLKTQNGTVCCPTLRQVVCTKCYATGDNAHNPSHCPLASTVPVAKLVKETMRSSNGLPKSVFINDDIPNQLRLLSL